MSTPVSQVSGSQPPTVTDRCGLALRYCDIVAGRLGFKWLTFKPQAGRATGEVEAAKTALLQLTRPEEKSEGDGEVQAEPGSPAKGGSPRAGEEADGADSAAAPPTKMTSAPTQLQWSLYEVWMSSAGVTSTTN